jgi:RNA polymerase sigma-70 factor (ECF subfamily)
MDEAILTRARAGDAAAMERLLTEVAPAVHRFGLRMCRHPHDVDDIVQDTLIAVAKNLSSFEGRSSLQSWVFTLARTACSRRRRGLKNQPHAPEVHAAELADDKASPEDELLRRDVTARVNAALDGLPVQFREVIELRDVQGLSAKEAADQLGLTVEALKSRLHRGRSMLRESLTREVARPRAGCPDVAAAFSKKLEGDLSDEDCAQMEKHVYGCPSCKAVCNALREVLSVCKTTVEGPVPPFLKKRVHEAVVAWANAH